MSRRGLVAVRGRNLGSGYWLGPETVVTAAHVVVDGGAPVPGVRLGGSDYRTTGSVTWFDARHDVALVRVDDAGGPPPVRFGGFASASEVIAATATGYPRAEATPETSNPHDAAGTVSPGTQPGPGRIAFSVTTATPLDPHAPAPVGAPPSSPWQGMSGAAIRCGPYVVAIAVDDPIGWTPARLNASRIDRLPAEFFDALEAAGIARDVEALRAGPGGHVMVELDDELEIALAGDLATLGVSALLRLGALIGLDDLPSDREATAAIVARELRRDLARALPAAVQSIARIDRATAYRLHVCLAPLVWLDPEALRRLETYISAVAPGRVVAVPASKTIVADACVRTAGGLYEVLPLGWGLGHVVPRVDCVDLAGWRAAVADAVVETVTGRPRDPFSLDPAGDEQPDGDAGRAAIARLLDEHGFDVLVLVVVPARDAPIDDELLAELMGISERLVFVTLIESEQRLADLRHAGCATVDPPFETGEAAGFVAMANRLNPAASRSDLAAPRR